MASDKVALLFDIDGTLIITDGAGATSWKLAFNDLYGIPADIDAYSDTGMTDPEVARRTFTAVVGHNPSASEFSRLLERRMHFLGRAVDEADGYRILPGVEALLPDLIDRGYLLGLVTGNLEGAAHIKLGRAGLNRFFAFGGYGSDSPDRATLTKVAMARACLVAGEEIGPEQFLAFGDTPNDVEAAHRAGIECVAVASHKYTFEQLSAAGADWVLHSFEEALPLER